MRAHTIRIIPVDDGLIDAIKRLKSELDREISADVRQAALDLLDEPEQLVRIYTNDSTASDTGELTVHFEPSDRFRMLLVALRAGNIDLLIAQQTAHS